VINKKISILTVILFCIFLNACANTENEENKEIKTSIENAENKKNEDSIKNEEVLDMDTIIKIYEEFLAGNISLGDLDIDFICFPKGEPDRPDSSKYAFFDSNGDNLPELHVKSTRYYYIFTVQNGELTMWKNLSPYPYYIPLDNGGFLRYHDETSMYGRISYNYIIYNFSGDEVINIYFYEQFASELLEQEDGYFLDDVELTKEQWEALTRKFFKMKEGDSLQLDNEIEWTVIYE